MGFSYRTFKRLLPEPGKADGGGSVQDFGKGIFSAAQIVGLGVASAVDVVSDVASFGDLPDRFSLHTLGGLIEWSKLSAAELESLSAPAATDPPDLSPESLRLLREQAGAAWKALGNPTIEKLPELAGRDAEAGALAQLLFPELAKQLEELARAGGVTASVLIEGKLGAELTLPSGFGVCVSAADKPSWGFVKSATNPVKGKPVSLDSGAILDLTLLLVFGPPDRFSAASFVSLGEKGELRPLGLRTQVLLSANDKKFLGLRLLDRLHVYIPPKGLLFDRLLGELRSAGNEWSIGLSQAQNPGQEDRAANALYARGFSLFKPRFYGRLRVAAAKTDWLVHSGERFAVATKPVQGSRSIFRIVAGLANLEQVSLESLLEDGSDTQYLRASEKGVSLGRYDDSAAFASQCTFELVRGLGDASGISLRSGTRYLALVDGTLVLCEASALKDKASATFLLVGSKAPAAQSALLPEPPHSLPSGELRRAPSGRFFVMKNADGRLGVYTGSGPKDARLPPRPHDSAGSYQCSDKEMQPLGAPGPTFTVLTDEGYLATLQGTPQKPGELVWSSKHGAMHWATSRKRVQLRAASGTYLMAEDGGNSFLRWDSAVAKAWETFELVTLWNGKVALRSHGGLYASARWTPETLGHVNLRAVMVDRPAVSDWDAFELVKQDGDKVAVRAGNGRLLRCDPTGRVTADGLPGDPLTVFSLSNVEMVVEDPLKNPNQPFHLVSKSSGLLLSMPHGRVDQVVVAEQWDNAGGLHQTFLATPIEGGGYTLTLQHSGKVLEVSDTLNRLVQRTASKSPAQTFLLEKLDDGCCKVGVKGSTRVLDVHNGSRDRGALIHQWDWLGTDNQRWRLVPAKASLKRVQPKGQWQSLGGDKVSEVSGLGLVDGRIAIFYLGGDGVICTRRQTERGGDFAAAKSLGSKAKVYAVAQNIDGRVTIAYMSPDDKCLVRTEKTIDGEWSEPVQIDQNNSHLTFSAQRDGRLVLLVRGFSSKLGSITQKTPGGEFAAPVDHSGSIGTGIGAARAESGNLYAFVHPDNSGVFVCSASQPNGSLDRWENLGGGTHDAPTAAMDQNGRLHMFTRGSDNACWSRRQSAPNAGWEAYVSLGGYAFDFTPALSASGELFLYCRTNNELFSKQFLPAGWSDWKPLKGDIRGRPAPVVTPDGIAVFVQGGDGAVWLYF